jgi:hypothetical protein
MPTSRDFDANKHHNPQMRREPTWAAYLDVHCFLSGIRKSTLGAHVVLG